MFWIFLDTFVSAAVSAVCFCRLSLQALSAGCLCRLSLQAVSAGCLCRLSLQLNPLNPLESFLEQLGRPGILAPQSYLTVLWISWAPRVSRVSRALFSVTQSNFHHIFQHHSIKRDFQINL